MSIIIRLQNLPWSANSLDIRRFFAGLSIPEGGVHIVGGEMGDAFIAFSTDEDARLAMEKDGGKIKDMQIKLLLSSRTEMMRVIEQARQQNMVIAQPQMAIPQQPPILSLQQPARIIPPASEPDRKRGHSPSPHRHSRDRSPARDRRRSPDDRRASKRDRSRSPSRSSRNFNRDMDRRSDRFKRDDRRYDDSRYRDDRRSERDLMQESKRYPDADHVNSKSQLLATEGFRNMPLSYEQGSTVAPGMYPYGNQQVATKSFQDTYVHGSANLTSHLPQTEQIMPHKPQDFQSMADQRYPVSSTYPNDPLLYHGQGSESSARDDSVSLLDQSMAKSRRRTRFEPEFVPTSAPSHFPSADMKLSSQNQRELPYNDIRNFPGNFSGAYQDRNVWPHETMDRADNRTWNGKQEKMLNPALSKNEDYLQVVPMDIEQSPSDISAEKDMYHDTLPHRGFQAPILNDDLRRDNRSLPLSVDKGHSNQDRGPIPHDENRKTPVKERESVTQNEKRALSSQDRGVPPHGNDRLSLQQDRGAMSHVENRAHSMQDRGPIPHEENRPHLMQDRGSAPHSENRTRIIQDRVSMSHNENRAHVITDRESIAHDENPAFPLQDRRAMARDNNRERPVHDREPMTLAENKTHPLQDKGQISHTESKSLAGPDRAPRLRDESRGSPAQDRGPVSHLDIRGQPLTKDSPGRGQPVPNDSPSRGQPVHNDSPSRVPPSLTVEVRGLPPDARIDDILDLFHGIPLPAANIHIEANDHGLEKAFIRFVSAADFEEALRRNRQFMREGRCELIPCPAAAFDSVSRSQKPRPKMKPRGEDLTVQLRGLPFSCKEEDIVNFFDGLGILDLFIEIAPDGRASGIGFVEFGTNEDFRAALAMNGKMIGPRYITISIASKEMMAFARGEDFNPELSRAHSDPQFAESGHPSKSPVNQGRPLPSHIRPPAPLVNQAKQGIPPPHTRPPPCIGMKGLPEGVTNREIIDFLSQVNVMPRAVHIMLRPDKTPSGEAFAEFGSPADFEAVLQLDGNPMRGNRVSIQPILFHEMSEILGRPSMPPPPSGYMRTPNDPERSRRPPPVDVERPHRPPPADLERPHRPHPMDVDRPHRPHPMDTDRPHRPHPANVDRPHRPHPAEVDRPHRPHPADVDRPHRPPPLVDTDRPHRPPLPNVDRRPPLGDVDRRPPLGDIDRPHRPLPGDLERPQRLPPDVEGSHRSSPADPERSHRPPAADNERSHRPPPVEPERPRRTLLPQGPTEAGFRERPRMEPPSRPFGPGRMRPPWPSRPFNSGSRPEGRFPPPTTTDRGLQDFGAPGCVVSINNLHFRAGLEELLDFFRDYRITKDSIRRKYNDKGLTTGEARIAFPSPRDAQRAVRELNQKPIMGRPLTLSVL